MPTSLIKIIPPPQTLHCRMRVCVSASKFEQHSCQRLVGGVIQVLQSPSLGTGMASVRSCRIAIAGIHTPGGEPRTKDPRLSSHPFGSGLTPSCPGCSTPALSGEAAALRSQGKGPCAPRCSHHTGVPQDLPPLLRAQQRRRQRHHACRH